jgi:hypothetical protein
LGCHPVAVVLTCVQKLTVEFLLSYT